MANGNKLIATFHTAEEAHDAQRRLQEQGIKAVVSGEANAGTDVFGLPHEGGVELYVSDSDLDRAQRALASLASEATLEEGWEEKAEAAVTGWICRVCDTEVPSDEDDCPECGTPRSEQPPEGEEDEDEE